MSWIPINLPWGAPATAQDSYNTLNREYTAAYNAIRDQCPFPMVNLDAWGYSDDLTDRLAALTAIAPELSDTLSFASKAWFDVIKSKYIDSPSYDDICLLALRRYNSANESIWLHEQLSKTDWRKRLAEGLQARRSTCFKDHQLCAAGVIVELEDPPNFEAPFHWQGASPRRHLIGDVNRSGGLCDDCRIPDEILVVRVLDLRELIGNYHLE